MSPWPNLPLSPYPKEYMNLDVVPSNTCFNPQETVSTEIEVSPLSRKIEWEMWGVSAPELMMPDKFLDPYTSPFWVQI